MSDLVSVTRTDRGELAAVTAKLGLRDKMDLAPVIATVQNVLDEVRSRGDAAVLELTKKFDRVELQPEHLRVRPEEISAALASLDTDLVKTMREAAANITRFHQAQLTPDLRLPTEYGGYTGLIQRPLDLVGVYVPGGSAPLPSSVLMNVLPAKAAGVRRIVMCTPPRADGTVHPAILAAAAIAGVDEIYRVGGSQAIAAMAYGTATIPAVDKICGPGNIYVNTAKRLVFGHCDIDMFAGPSEILIIADETATPSYVAADMLSQAEHDPLASSILVTTSDTLAEQVASELTRRVPLLPRKAILERSLKDYGAILVVPDLDSAIEFADELAPEHLELCLADPAAEQAIARIRHAGAIFIGHFSPEPLGDYFAGPNHVLPTSGTARFFSPLNTADFLKKTSLIHYTRRDLEAVWEKVARFADSEQLAAHADALRVRFGADIASTLSSPVDQPVALSAAARGADVRDTVVRDVARDARRLWSRKVHTLTPYIPGEQPRDRQFIKLNTNENPYPPAPGVIDALQSYPMERLKLYPDPTGMKLRTTISERYDLPIEQIFVGNGSDEVLAMAFQAFFNHHIDPASATPKEQIVFPDITYSFYPVYAMLYEIPFRRVELAGDFTIPLDALAEPSGGIVLANPNAPTGVALNLDQIRFLAESDRDRLILVDEAYVDFGGESAVALLGEFDNILVIQTLSKSRSLAGLRVGFAFGDPHLIAALERVRDSFNSYTLDSLAQTCAVAAFSDSNWFENTRAKVMATRERTIASLNQLGFHVLPSTANFIFVRHNRIVADNLYSRLREEGILVRHFRQPRIDNFLRISIGTDPEMDTLITTLEQIVRET